MKKLSIKQFEESKKSLKVDSKKLIGAGGKKDPNDCIIIGPDGTIWYT